MAFRHSLSQFLADEVWPHVDEWDEAGEFPWWVHEKAGALGVFGLGIDEAYGGLGFDSAFMRAALWQEFGRRCSGGVTASLGARNIMTGPLQALASEEIKKKAPRGDCFRSQGRSAGHHGAVRGFRRCQYGDSCDS